MIGKSIKVLTTAVALLVIYGFLCIFGASVVDPLEAYAATEYSEQLYFTFDNGILTFSNYETEGAGKWPSDKIPENVTKIVFGSEGDEIAPLQSFAYDRNSIPITSVESIDFQHYQGPIFDKMFYSNHKLTDITLPDNITTVGKNAFWNCNQLKSVTLPESVKWIEIGAFQKCTALESINLDNVQFLERECFSGCSSLKEIAISSSVPDEVFYECSNLEKVTFISAPSYIYEGAFYGCKSLKEITIPEGLKSLEVNAFIGCSNLEKITLPRSFNRVTISRYPESFLSRMSPFPSSKNLTIYGYSGSYAERYAKEKKIPFVSLDEEKAKYTVIFADWDGQELSRQQVEAGSSAVAPSSPTRSGYTFKEWDKDYSNITSDLTIIAVYEADENDGGGAVRGGSTGGGAVGGGSTGGGAVGGGSAGGPGIKGASSSATPTFSKNWVVDVAGIWRIKDKSGNFVTSAWLCDDAVAANGQNVWYLMNTDGTMLAAGLVQDDTGNFYSLEMNHNGFYGMLRYINGTYDGIYIEFSQKHDGTFGAITNQSAIDALKAKYGITKFGIGNDRCVYTKSFE